MTKISWESFWVTQTHIISKILYLMLNSCGWLNFRGVPIFVVFLESLINEFQYPRNDVLLYELWRKKLWPWILNPTNVWFLFNPRKLEPTKIKASTVLHLYQHSGFNFLEATIIMGGTMLINTIPEIYYFFPALILEMLQTQSESTQWSVVNHICKYMFMYYKNITSI